MAYRPLTEPGEVWKVLTKKINDALEYLDSKITSIFAGANNSITQDTDGMVHLVNDLSDGELIPDSVYGVSSAGQRGWIKIKNSKSFLTTDWTAEGDVYAFEFEHNLGSQDVIVQVYENNKKVEVDIEIIDSNTIKLSTNEVFSGKVVVEG